MKFTLAKRSGKPITNMGELGWADALLTGVIFNQFKNEKTWEIIIDALGRLAEQTEIMEADPTLGWTEIRNLTEGDRKKILDKHKTLSGFSERGKTKRAG